LILKILLERGFRRERLKATERMIRSS